jgi:hypothetical protein
MYSVHHTRNFENGSNEKRPRSSIEVVWYVNFGMEGVPHSKTGTCTSC